jgi:hypothetical protein
MRNLVLVSAVFGASPALAQYYRYSSDPVSDIFGHALVGGIEGAILAGIVSLIVWARRRGKRLSEASALKTAALSHSTNQAALNDAPITIKIDAPQTTGVISSLGHYDKPRDKRGATHFDKFAADQGDAQAQQEEIEREYVKPLLSTRGKFLLGLTVFLIVVCIMLARIYDGSEEQHEAQLEAQLMEETRASGLPITVTDQSGSVYYGRYNEKTTYVVISDANGNDVVWGYVGYDGKPFLCGKNGSVAGRVQTPTLLYVDIESVRWANLGCKHPPPSRSPTSPASDTGPASMPTPPSSPIAPADPAQHNSFSPAREPEAVTDPFSEALAAWQRQDYATAFHLWRPLADLGDARAQVHLGYMYANGRGVPQDYAEALKWFRKAADQGNAAAQASLGYMYANGQGIPQNYAEAVKWYRMAADQGNAAAQNNLGHLYASGQGVAHDYAEAVKLYRKAANEGLAESQDSLGGMYRDGQGVRRDYTQAYMWFSLAALQASQDAAKAREALAARMSPAQIAEAQRLAREWKPTGAPN